MGSDGVNKPQATRTQNVSAGYNKPLPETPKGLFARFKISVIKQSKSWFSKTIGALFGFRKNDSKTTQNRKVIKSKQKNKITKENKAQQASSVTIDADKTENLKEINSESPSFQKDLLDTKKPEEEIYMNLQDVPVPDEVVYVNVQGIQQLKKEQSINSIRNSVDALGKCLQSGKREDTTKSSEETKALLQSIRDKAKQFQPEELVTVNNKFRGIVCPIHSSATKHNIYHANKITIGGSNYIAAQGPYTQGNDISIAGDFIAMMAENDSPISISLVKESEFNDGKKPNEKLPPQQIGETINIPAKTKNNKTIRQATTITMIDSIKDSNNGLQVDILSINGKQHVRIYDLTWKDHTGGDPRRLAAISLFVKHLGELPELKDRKGQPTIVNCNAGVGRTGTTILVDHMRKEIEQGKTLSESQLEKDILDIRNNRPTLVQEYTQLETLKSFVAKGDNFISNMEGYFKV
jgi:protein tyrosine phosphatase